MEALPGELLARIAHALPNEDVASAAAASRAWRRLWNSAEVWSGRELALRVGLVEREKLDAALAGVESENADLELKEKLSPSRIFSTLGAPAAALRLLSSTEAAIMLTRLRTAAVDNVRVRLEVELYQAVVSELKLKKKSRSTTGSGSGAGTRSIVRAVELSQENDWHFDDSSYARLCAPEPSKGASIADVVAAMPAAAHSLKLNLCGICIKQDSRRALKMLQAMGIAERAPQLLEIGIAFEDLVDREWKSTSLELARSIIAPATKSTTSTNVNTGGLNAFGDMMRELQTRPAPPEFVHPLTAIGGPSSRVERLLATLRLCDWKLVRTDLDWRTGRIGLVREEYGDVAAFNMKILDSFLASFPALRYLEELVVGEMGMELEPGGVGPSALGHAALLSRVAAAGIAVGRLTVEACALDGDVATAIQRVVATEPRCRDVQLKFVEPVPGVLSRSSFLGMLAGVETLCILFGDVLASNYESGDIYWMGSAIDDNFLDWLFEGGHTASVEDLTLGFDWHAHADPEAESAAARGRRVLSALAAMPRLRRLGLDFVSRWGLAAGRSFNVADVSRAAAAAAAGLRDACPSLRRLHFPQLSRDAGRGDGCCAAGILGALVEAAGARPLLDKSAGTSEGLWVEMHVEPD